MEADVIINGVGFMSLYHHDGRFVHGGGLFAFSRRDPDGGRTILHFELARAISQTAGPGHPSWAWALGQGMNELLVHLAGSQQVPGELEPGAVFAPLRYVLFDDSAEARALLGDPARPADHAA